MKKIAFFVLCAFMCMMVGFSSCSGCKSNKEADKVTTDSVASLTVENLISTDRQEMFMQYAKDYRWFETCIRLENYLDEENDGTISELVNIFQVFYGDETGGDVYVYKFQHTADGALAVDSIHGFWIEDYPLNEEAIKITFKEAFDKLMQANCPKPHSKNCILRKEIGPKDCNPQYIFGNLTETVYVDAVDGTVRTESPAWDNNLKKPLGEWP